MANAAPISLYFQLEPGEMPDLEVVARASIAWNNLLKEVVSLLDPSLEVRVELLSATIGSRSINSIVRATQKVAVEHPWTVGPLIAIAGAFFLAPFNHAGTGHHERYPERCVWPFSTQVQRCSSTRLTSCARRGAPRSRRGQLTLTRRASERRPAVGAGEP